MTDSMEGKGTAFFKTGRVLNRELFIYFLDFEVKRARRYQNYLSLLFMKFIHSSNAGDEKDLQTSYQTFTELIEEEFRETDLLGSLGEDRLAVLIPYADEETGKLVKSRFEKNLKHYDFKTNGFEIAVQQINFPINGTSAMDILKKALGPEAMLAEGV
jgi:GGDEF domain-containing protein